MVRKPPKPASRRGGRRRAAAAAPAPPAATWNARERAAWRAPPRGRPSQWAPLHFRIRRGDRKGPYRHDNAPYLAGMMDILTTPGCVQGNLRAAVQMGKSTLMRILMAYWAHTDPGPMGLTLPNRDKGRGIAKTDILPLFRHTPVLRELIGSCSRDALIETVQLLNGFSLDLMWSGSATSMASNPYQRVINDEVDKFEPWTGEEADAIAATEGRLTTYGDARLQLNASTPTTTSGTIHRLWEQSTVQLHYHVPCPHCGTYQALRWGQLKWMDRQCADVSLDAVLAARAAGVLAYAIAWDAEGRRWRHADLEGGSAVRFDSPQALAAHLRWLGMLQAALGAVQSRRELADVLSSHRDQAVWYECGHCRGRIHPADKAAMIRAGRWTSLSGTVNDADGVEHADAATVTRWAPETRIGFALSALYALWTHWGLLVKEWLGAQSDPAALFSFTTFRLGEPFEFRSKRVAQTLFSAKCARAPLDEGIVPEWAWCLLAAIDTQPDRFYAVVRAWGGGLRSARVWHGELMDFDALDRLIYVQEWPVRDNLFGPMKVARALIDSGGTLDQWLTISRTQQVYGWTIPRQPTVTAIKGSNRPGTGLYWPMRNPMSHGGKVDVTDLKALMIDPHKANDLLAEMIVTGLPSASAGQAPPAAVEQWALNRRDDPVYNAHMASVQRTMDPKSRLEVWTPKGSGVRHDYRDCESYQVVAAYLAHVDLLPEEAEVLAAKREQLAAAAPSAGDEPQYVSRFRRR